MFSRKSIYWQNEIKSGNLTLNLVLLDDFSFVLRKSNYANSGLNPACYSWAVVRPPFLSWCTTNIWTDCSLGRGWAHTTEEGRKRSGAEGLILLQAQHWLDWAQAKVMQPNHTNNTKPNYNTNIRHTTADQQHNSKVSLIKTNIINFYAEIWFNCERLETMLEPCKEGPMPAGDLDARDSWRLERGPWKATSSSCQQRKRHQRPRGPTQGIFR